MLISILSMNFIKTKPINTIHIKYSSIGYFYEGYYFIFVIIHFGLFRRILSEKGVCQ